MPPFLRNTGKGWVTAEYGMLPRSTATRTDREAARGRQSGRHAGNPAADRPKSAGGDRSDPARRAPDQDRLRCIQADGGTRTAAVTGSYVALHLAFQRLLSAGVLKVLPLRDNVAAVSCGVIANTAVLDLDYAEDSQAMTDANFVLTGMGGIVEIQATAEGAPFGYAVHRDVAPRAARDCDLTRCQRVALGLA